MSAPLIVVLCEVSVTCRPLVRRSPAELVLCMSLRVISCNVNLVHLQWAERCKTTYIHACMHAYIHTFHQSMTSLKGHSDMKHCQIKNILTIIDHY